MAIDFKRIFDNAHIPNRADVNKGWVNCNCPFCMHGGITYVRNDGDSIKIGDDYMHWGDELTQKSKELPGEVKHEAEELFEYLRRNEL